MPVSTSHYAILSPLCQVTIPPWFLFAFVFLFSNVALALARWLEVGVVIWRRWRWWPNEQFRRVKKKSDSSSLGAITRLADRRADGSHDCRTLAVILGTTGIKHHSWCLLSFTWSSWNCVYFQAYCSLSSLWLFHRWFVSAWSQVVISNYV